MRGTVVQQKLNFGRREVTPSCLPGRVGQREIVERVLGQVSTAQSPGAESLQRAGVVGTGFSRSALCFQSAQCVFDAPEAAVEVAQSQQAQSVSPPGEMEGLLAPVFGRPRHAAFPSL